MRFPILFVLSLSLAACAAPAAVTPLPAKPAQRPLQWQAPEGCEPGYIAAPNIPGVFIPVIQCSKTAGT